jgi:RHH-type rel operon transcriptional repressor/antitoxin RelB
MCNTCIAKVGMGGAVSLRLPEKVRVRLERLARRTGRSKTFYMIEAITEKIEDLEDLYLADEVARRVRSGKEKTWSLDEVERDLGLDDSARRGGEVNPRPSASPMGAVNRAS